ncbi:MAG: hypothetical protein H7Z11_02200 [Verrucomicrobia bacterium]|nr:hypothetical protein [Leptolyngbya sp. ES-bin-22]
MAVSIRAGRSNVLAEVMVQRAGCDASLLLASISTIALAVFWFYVPETKTVLRSAAVQP